MSSLALMRFLESVPSRYDWGMKIITFGGVDRVHGTISKLAVKKPGDRVLEIGCGTGAVTERLIRSGARVLALDQNPEMLDIAKLRIQDIEPKPIEWQESTAAEIDRLPEETFDAVVISLCLSDMDPHERKFVLRQSLARLKDSGKIVIGDEVVPRHLICRLIGILLRLPQIPLAWLLTGFLSKPIKNLTEELIQAGFEIEFEKRWRFESLAVVVGGKRR